MVKQIIITGGTEGIGRAIIESLDQDEWKICLISKNKQRGEEVVKYLRSKNFDCFFYPIDLSNIEYIEKEIKKILIDFRDVYAVINNAGVGYPSKIENVELEEVMDVFSVNLFAPLLLIKNIMPIMKRNGIGRIINISSVAGKLAVPFLTSYSASKAGLISITQALAKELGSSGITVNCICPACVDTRLAQEGRKKLAKLKGVSFNTLHSGMVEQTCINRVLLPCEVAKMVKFLLDEESSFITGQSINVCGAYEVR